jgi:protoheme IX farnesyltransferase
MIMFSNLRSHARSYYRLMKPGIIYGNALMFAAGFFLASAHGIDWPLFLESLAGLSLVIGSACVFNNIADRAMDAKMERTKKRAIPSGKISTRAALMYGVALFAFGSALLYYFSTIAALVSALIGFAVYVFFYTPLKPRTRYALFVGAVAGAMPPVAGYTAVTNAFDLWALGLFAALFVWQLPHFISIAVYRFEDYSMAGVPLFARAPKNDRERKLARQVFAASLIILLAACLGIALWRLLLT